jgi:hypothetical protein
LGVRGTPAPFEQTLDLKLLVPPLTPYILVTIFIIHQQNARMKLNTCIIINTVPHVSALIGPSSGRTFVVCSKLCYNI